MEKGNRKVQYLVTLCASVAAVTMGLSSAWPTPVIPKLKNNETNIEITKDEVAWMLSMSAPGFMAGSFASGFMLDQLGRRSTLLWSALPYGLGMTMAAISVSPWMLYLTQFLWSAGTAILSVVMTIYFAEISDKDIRASLQLLTKFAFNLGCLLTMCVGPLLSFSTLNYILLVMPFSYFVACFWIPESPYFYLKEGKVKEAKKVLATLRGYNKNEKRLEEDFLQMQEDVKKETRRSSSPKELFTRKQYRKAIIIAAGLKMTQIMTGAVTIQQYLGLIMEDSGIDWTLPKICITFGAIRFVVSLLPSVLADKLGRRPLLIYSYFGVTVCLAVVGIYFFLMEVIGLSKEVLSPYGFITLTGIICSNVISTIGFQSIVHVVAGEIFPLNVKATAMTALSIFGGVLSFLVARGYQILKDCLGLCGVFWIFAGVALFGAIFSIAIIPETKGKSLREIQEQLQGDFYYEDEVATENMVIPNGTCESGNDDVELRELKKHEVA
ncbi:facilitated trehalose transporter Tret1-like isoform X2 [Hyposmocoma kahamanoa]|nr:facilitated trehalose transporter Tret1-like isoform X2 [Hyposmocoma kahamanoa]XP_026317554.1 facilitated trehalose transporter Tret1-like isoform X2 [Hyposmocoma kahamanoa]